MHNSNVLVVPSANPMTMKIIVIDLGRCSFMMKNDQFCVMPHPVRIWKSLSPDISDYCYGDGIFLASSWNFYVDSFCTNPSKIPCGSLSLSGTLCSRMSSSSLSSSSIIPHSGVTEPSPQSQQQQQEEEEEDYYYDVDVDNDDSQRYESPVVDEADGDWLGVGLSSLSLPKKKTVSSRMSNPSTILISPVEEKPGHGRRHRNKDIHRITAI